MAIDYILVHTHNDIQSVISLASRIWRECYPAILSHVQIEYMIEQLHSETAIREQMAAGMRYYLVAVDGVEHGYCAVLPQPECGDLFISKFYLEASVRGKGNGKALMTFVEGVAREHALTRLTLTVNKNNRLAIDAYTRYGFVVINELVKDIGGGFVMDDYTMAKEIAVSHKP